MPESDRTVKCPICDEDFDPAVAGGWCTNPDCGEWQHTEGTDEAAATAFDADDDPESPDLIAEGTDDTGSEGGDSSTQTTDESAVDDTVSAPSEADADTAADDSEADSAATDRARDESVDAESPPEDGAVSASDGPASETERDDGATTETERDEDAEADDGPGDEQDNQTQPLTADESDDSATIRCPGCDTELAADANFCVECGADVQELPNEDDSLEACPSCDTEVDADDSFCVNCGEDLDAHRGAATTESAATNGTAPDASGSGNAALTAQSPDDEAVPEQLVLSVAGREITVEDGDRIGREIRAALLDAGRPEDEAVRIHREHVRFDRQPDGYYLVDLGDNPTRLNGTPLKKGDREPIQEGDELGLSGVVTMTIEAK